jgi:hypothetical protein
LDFGRPLGKWAQVITINYLFGGRGGLYEAALIEAHRQLIIFLPLSRNWYNIPY